VEKFCVKCEHWVFKDRKHCCDRLLGQKHITTDLVTGKGKVSHDGVWLSCEEERNGFTMTHLIPGIGVRTFTQKPWRGACGTEGEYFEPESEEDKVTRLRT
jgi:hypothetical protein